MTKHSQFKIRIRIGSKSKTVNSICMFPFSKNRNNALRYKTPSFFLGLSLCHSVVCICGYDALPVYWWALYDIKTRIISWCVIWMCAIYIWFRLHLYWWTGCTLHINWIEFVLYLLLFPSYCSRHRRESKMQMSLPMLQEKLDSYTRHHRKIEKTASK